MTTEVFDAAVSVARKIGYRNVTRGLIAEQMSSKGGKFEGQLEKANNWLVNHASMEEISGDLIAAKDRLALVPGDRAKSAQASYWRRFDRQDMLETAYRLATTDGLFSLSMTKVAEAAGFSRGTVNNYFTDLEGLRCAVVAMAVEHENLKICAQAIANEVPCASIVPDELRQLALKSLA